VPPELRDLLDAVDRAYREFDDDRVMLERSLEMSSSELLVANVRMRAAFEALPDLFLHFDGDGRLLAVEGGGPREARLSAALRMGDRLQTLAVPALARALMQAAERSRRTGQAEEAEFEIAVGDDRVCYGARVFASPDAQTVAIVRDVTETRTAAEALALQERFLRRVIDLIPGFVFTKDREGRFTMVNRALLDAYGLDEDAVLGHSEAELSPDPERAARIADEEARVLRDGRPVHVAEERVVDARGRARWLQTVKVPIELNGNGRQILAASADITRWKEVEQRLRDRSHELVRKQAILEELALGSPPDRAAAIDHVGEVTARALQATRVGLFTLNEERTALTCERSFDAGHGASAGGIELELGRFPEYFEALQESRMIAVQDPRRDPRTRRVAEAFLADGYETALLDVPVRLQGRLIGVLCVRRDTGAEWSLEEEDLVASIADFTSTMLESNRRHDVEAQLLQSQKMEAIGLLAGGVAHDFNNLLSVILGYGEIAASQLEAGDPVRNDLAMMRDAADRAADLTRKLLTFSRRQVVEMVAFDLDGLLGDYVDLLHRIVGEDVRVVVERAGRPVPVHGDRGQVNQILLNLSTNAREAMPGGGRLTIGVRAVDVCTATARRYGLERGGNFAELWVRDTGVGMSDEVRARLWEPFFTTKGSGTGLGLAVVYGVVERHRGFVLVESEEKVGSTFRIFLPLSPESVQPGSAAPAARIAGRETILVAEDEILVQGLLVAGLRQLGYTVVTADDGRSALELVRTRDDIDAVVLDVVMPQLGAADACERMRSVRPYLPVVFVSGYAPDEGRLSSLLEQEGTAFVPKPFVVATVAARLRALLDARGAPGASPERPSEPSLDGPARRSPARSGPWGR
jgi:PAS domain S-box-containing protein